MDVEREQQEHARRLEQGRRALAGLDEDWARHVQAIGPCRLALPPEVEPWEALLRAIVYQQLHGRAAGAIHQRLLALYPAGRPTPRDLLATSPEQLRLCGLSAAKAQAILGVARAADAGELVDRAGARAHSDEALIRQWTQLRGVGPWTAKMVLIDALGRTDVLPAGDLGLRQGYQRLRGRDAAPTEAELRQLAEAWRPHRTVAAWYLWRVPRR